MAEHQNQQIIRPFAHKLTTPADLQKDILNDFAAIKGIPTQVAGKMQQQIKTILAKSPNPLRFTSFVLKGQSPANIENEDLFSDVVVVYGVAGLPGVLRQEAACADIISKDTLSIFRLGHITVGQDRQGKDWSVFNTTYPAELDIHPGILDMLATYKQDTEAGQRAILQSAQENSNSGPRLATLAFVYHCFSENIPLESYVAEMRSSVKWAPSAPGPRPALRSATFVVSPDGRIVIGKHGANLITKRFLVAPGGQFVALPTPANNAGHDEDLLPHQEKWLAKGDLASFQREAGLQPSRNFDWDPATMSEVRAHIVRDKLLLFGPDLDR